VRGTSLSVRHIPSTYGAAPQTTQQAQLPRSAQPMAPMTDEANDVRAGGPDNGALADPFDGPEGGN
jgi:hypothetical protein